MESSIKQRDYTWDILKFLLIVLVILGHWLLNNLNGSSVNRIVYNFRGLFTIPLFIFISGYFSRKKTTDKFIKQILNLLETYIVVQILYEVSSYYLLHKAFTFRALFTPNYSAWFLLSLMFWRMMVQFIPEKWLKSKLIVPACVMISIAAGFIPVGYAFSLQRTLALSPFFVCGYILRGSVKFGNTPEKLKWVCISVILAVFVGSCVFLDRDIKHIFWCSQSYYLPDGLTWSLLFYRTIFLVVAATMVFCILKVFPESKNMSFLSRLGEDTLYYYVYHVLVMRVGQIFIHRFNLPLTFPAMLLYTLCTIILIFYILKISFFRKILNPFSSFIQK